VLYGLPGLASQAGQASRYSPGTSVAPSLDTGRPYCCCSSLICCQPRATLSGITQAGAARARRRSGLSQGRSRRRRVPPQAGTHTLSCART
jgi:hypothetical protein